MRTDQALPYADAFATSFSLAAQLMQARKHLENWAVWIVVDLVYVGMVRTQDLDLHLGALRDLPRPRDPRLPRLAPVDGGRAAP